MPQIYKLYASNTQTMASFFPRELDVEHQPFKLQPKWQEDSGGKIQEIGF